MIRTYLMTLICLLLSSFLTAQCPTTISSLGQGNGLQVCWPRNGAPATLDSITYDGITYVGNFVNAGQGDCWRTTDAATTGTNGNHEIAFVFDGTNVVCEVINGVVNPVPTHLPVDYLYYNLSEKNGVVHVLWETAQEKNNDYFLVQRSKDGIEFQTIAQIAGAGAASAYEYQDVEASHLGGTFYYRLQQVDVDGTSEYSATRTITVTLSSEKEIRVFPNPAQDYIHIVLTEGVEEHLQLAVFDMTGRMVLQQQLSNSDEGQTNHISLNDFQQGCYIAKVTGTYFSQSIPFVKK